MLTFSYHFVPSLAILILNRYILLTCVTLAYLEQSLILCQFSTPATRL